MISSVFETERFRVHIVGKAAWVETKEGENWVFRNQHALPVSGHCGDSDALKAAVEHFEETRRGDTSLRSALTGIRPERVQPAVKRSIPIATKPPAKSPALAAKSAHAKKSLGFYGFRAPLRPPLLAVPTTPNN